LVSEQEVYVNENHRWETQCEAAPVLGDQDQAEAHQQPGSSHLRMPDNSVQTCIYEFSGVDITFPLGYSTFVAQDKDGQPAEEDPDPPECVPDPPYPFSPVIAEDENQDKLGDRQGTSDAAEGKWVQVEKRFSDAFHIITPFVVRIY
jgi:hypothetical protein